MKRLLLTVFILLFTTNVFSKTVLGVSGSQITINDKPVFLYGISYYGALSATNKNILADLDDMQRYGFNWIRVWATWTAFGENVSVVDGEGNPVSDNLKRFKWLVGECARRGIVVDVTVSRGYGTRKKPKLGTLETLGRAAETLANGLRNYRNWYLDLANEHNVRDQRFVSSYDCSLVRRRVMKIDSKRLVTASFAGDLPRDQLKKNLFLIQVDFITPHRARNAKSPSETAKKTKEYLATMRQLGRVIPVLYQEPFRRGFQARRWEPKAADFLADVTAAKKSGAAGWCFHNGDQKNNPDRKPRRSFDMRTKRLFEQLDAEENSFIRQAMKIIHHP